MRLTTITIWDPDGCKQELQVDYDSLRAEHGVLYFKDANREPHFTNCLFYV